MIRSVQGKSCPVCLGQRTEFYAETNGCTYNRCNDCTTLFQIHEMRCQYRNTQRGYASELEYRPDRDVRIESILAYRHLYALVGKHSTADIPRLLDVGGGSGHFADFLREQGFRDLTVIDPSITITNSDDVPFEYHPLTLEEFAARKPDTFDIITYNHVIEHIDQPFRELERTLDLLNEGGKIILTTPNIASFNSRYKLLRSRLGLAGRPYRILDAPKHVVLFNRTSMRAMTRQLGTALLELGTWTRPKGTGLILGPLQDRLGMGGHLYAVIAGRESQPRNTQSTVHPAPR